MSGPAERMEKPTEDVENYSTADLAETIKLFGQLGSMGHDF